MRERRCRGGGELGRGGELGERRVRRRAGGGELGRGGELGERRVRRRCRGGELGRAGGELGNVDDHPDEDACGDAGGDAGLLDGDDDDFGRVPHSHSAVLVFANARLISFEASVQTCFVYVPAFSHLSG